MGTSSASGEVFKFIMLTDVAGSSRLAEKHPALYHSALEKHNSIIEKLVRGSGGTVYKNTGDGYYLFFESAPQSLECARELASEFSNFPPVAEGEPFLVRIVLHGGALRPIGREFFGPALNRASRICQVCHPGQILASGAVVSAAEAKPGGHALIDLGMHHLRDLSEPEQLFQLDDPAFARREFPPLPTLSNRPNNLFRQPNAFIGRTEELSALRDSIRKGRRLVTLVAPGGYGKSRIAVQLCADMLGEFERGVFIVELAPAHDASGVPAELACVLGYQLSGSRDPEDQLVEYLRGKQMLVCFDNFEHVIDASAFVGKVLKFCPDVTILATSREPLKLAAENVFTLSPMPLADSGGTMDEIPDSVLLFADRTALVKPGFALDGGTLPLAMEICRKLSGIPLSIELAAAWADCFTLEELLRELSQQLELT